MHPTRLSPANVLLGFLAKNPCHGYELHQRLCNEFGYIWHVSQSQTYNILKRLENQGYISSTTIEQEKLPSRQLLQLTELGVEQFNTWLYTPTRISVHTIRVEFITRLYFIRQYHPSKTLDTIDIQIKEVRLGLVRLDSIGAGLPPEQMFNKLALDLRITLLSSIIRWLEKCRQEFTNDHS